MVKYTLVGALLLLIWGLIFVSTMPIRFVLDKVQVPSQVQLSAVSGTVWSGRAQVSWLGKVPAELPITELNADVSWRWCPLDKPLGLCLELDNPRLKGDFLVFYALARGTVGVENAHFEVRIDRYLLNYQGFEFPLSGIGLIHVNDLEFLMNKPVPEALEAQGELKDVRNDDAALGDYEWKVTLGQDMFKTDFSGGTDDFAVKGRWELDVKKSKYRYYVDLKSGSAELLQLLSSYAQASEKGKVTFYGIGALRL